MKELTKIIENLREHNIQVTVTPYEDIDGFKYETKVMYPGLKPDVFRFRNVRNVISFLKTVPVRYERFKREKAVIKAKLLSNPFVAGTDEWLDRCVLQLDCGATVTVSPPDCGGYDVKCTYSGYHRVESEWILNNDELAAYVQAVPRVQNYKEEEKTKSLAYDWKDPIRARNLLENLEKVLQYERLKYKSDETLLRDITDLYDTVLAAWISPSSKTAYDQLYKAVYGRSFFAEGGCLGV